MAGNNNHSQGPYPSALLNEVHTYFPALLYDSDNFNTVPQLMSYVQRQMSRNFDVYSNNRNQYLEQVYPRTPVNQVRRQSTYPPPPAARRQRINETSPLMTTVEESDEEDIASMTPAIAELIVNLLRSPPTTQRIPGWGGNLHTWLEPIPVRPSAQVLQTNTSVSVLSSNLTDNCSICQDSMETGATVRKINHCSHTFHRTCIDTWFITNVHCPTCRHDVRALQTVLPNLASNASGVTASRASASGANVSGANISGANASGANTT